ncbi:hypothetical protein BGW36DRAFT_357084 [Talaromyces proteolyticus]|uniref:Fungal N-terminal domain-containing protein n=1 Tax=Talaromyces proteolyticus TaxID=1131652 RepID=A0AAD4KT52_9EURO|nr:uncharacterized protein BGW36DRAFT_357084 [Talaromyces proteolyticus]KAH8700422.1 hypothetical protein BGW36DRAFT_357084 [Talaromyces proteolyticus]
MNDTGSIASAAGAGLRLALLLNAVACQVANLGVDIHSISKGITLFSTSLKQATQSLQSEHSVHTQECLDTAYQISDQARAVFEEVQDMLDTVQKPEPQDDSQPTPSVQQRFKTCFKKQRVTYLLAQLESLKFSLMAMIQVLQLGRLLEVRNVLNTITEELIAQERADAQNMLIVRYWSTKKLDRLWDLARQEALETAPSTPDSATPTPSKLPVIPLGVESSLNSVEESPKDMLRLTGAVLDALLKRWIRLEAGQRVMVITSNQAMRGASPHAYVSSGSEDDLSDDASSDHSYMQGYYLEGVTTDWRKPHSQDARSHAARLRKLYSNKQADVQSDSDSEADSETSIASSRRKAKKAALRKNKTFPASNEDLDIVPRQFSDRNEPEHRDQPTSRPYSYSAANKIPGCEAENSWRHQDTIPPKPQPAAPQAPPLQASQTRPIPMPQPNANGRPDRLATSQPSPSWATAQSPSNNRSGMHQHSSYYPPPSNTFYSAPGRPQPNFYPQQQQQQQQPRYNPPPSRAFGRTVSDNVQQQQQQQQQQAQKPQQYLSPIVPQQQQHRYRSSRSRKGNHSPQGYDRHKDLKRTAMRGILGVSAIGGFMDALEAFSII